MIARRVRETGEPVIGFEISCGTPEFPGQRRVWLVNEYPVPALQGGPGIGVIVEEITERKTSEERCVKMN
jgi:hypothetical protein